MRIFEHLLRYPVLLHQVVGLRPRKPGFGAADVTLVDFALLAGVNFPEVSSTIVNVREHFAASQTFALTGGEPNYAERSLLLQLLLLFWQTLCCRRMSLSEVEFCNKQSCFFFILVRNFLITFNGFLGGTENRFQFFFTFF